MITSRNNFFLCSHTQSNKNSIHLSLCNTLFTLAPWPWPSHGRARFCLHWASYTFAKLVNIVKTVSARISARVKCKHTPSPSELFYSYVLHVISGKIWRRPGQAKCKWDISPKCKIFRASVNRKARPAMAKLASIILAKVWSG